MNRSQTTTNSHLSNQPTNQPTSRKDRRLTNSELGDAVGVSASTIMRLEKRGFITRVGKTSRGWALFSESQIEEVKQHLQMRVPKNRESSTSSLISQTSVAYFEADVAARVFKELDLKKHPADIVQELVIHPDIVKSIFLAWKDLRGGLYIPQAIMDKINKLPLEGSFPVRTPEQLLQNLEESAAATLPQCGKCKKNYRELCRTCAELLYKH